MSKEEMQAQLKDMLLRREDLKKEISAISTALRERGNKIAELGRRLNSEPDTVRVEGDTIYLARRDRNDTREVPTLPASFLDVEYLRTTADELREKQAALRDTQAYLNSQGYPVN